MRYDREHAEGLKGVKLRDLKDLLLRSMGRSVVVLLFLMFAALVYCVLMVLSAVASQWFIVIGLLLLFFLAIALSHSLPVYVFEDDTTMFGAIGRGFQLGWLTWGGTFLVMLVIGILASVVQGVFSVPWYVCLFVKVLLMIEDDGSALSSSVGYSFLMYIIAVQVCFCYFLTAAFSVTALAYQYGSAAEQHDHISLDEGVEQFEAMTETSDEIADFEKL